MNDILVIPIPVLFFAGVGLLIVIGGLFISPKWAAVPFGLMLFAASISFAVDFNNDLIRTIFTPIQLRRNLIYFVAGSLLYIALFVHAGKFVRGTAQPLGLLLLAIGVYAGLVRTLNGFAQDGLESIGLVLATTAPAAIFLPNIIRDRGNALIIMRIIAIVMGIWLTMNFLQFMVNPEVLYPAQSGRFQGLSGNPQFAAIMLANALTISVWGALNDNWKILRPLWIVLIGALLVTLIWTGSRTGMLMFAIGASIVTFSRIGQLALVAPLVAGMAYFFLSYVIGDSAIIDAGRYGDFSDTRSAKWAELLQTFFTNPVFGTGDPNLAGGSENSYLLSIATYGVFMGVLVLGLVLIGAYQSLMLFTKRRQADKRTKALIDLALAGYAMYFSGAVFEGFIVGRIHTANVFLLFFGALATRLLVMPARADASEQLADELAENDEYDEYAEDWTDYEPVERDDTGYADDSWHGEKDNAWVTEDDWSRDEERHGV